jgi:CubicO group peptidase (beta-lactamase class C family)
MEGLRTNALHLPVRGSGDGGLYTTAADVRAFWRALLDGTLLPVQAVRMMTSPRSRSASGRRRYGLGFWLDGSGPGIALEGYDAGVSFRSEHDPLTGAATTVLANTSEGAWAMLEGLDAAGPTGG